MRADIENLVTSVEKSLELLRQRMDWDTVSHRLEEFDARVENPNLWDNPEEAQKLMRERQTLLDAMEGHNQIRDDLSYNIEMIALGEEEQDSEIVSEAEKAISLLAKTAASKELEALLNGEADANDTFFGVHRLVRISPFDSSAKRHTSFCSIWVYPVVDDNIDIEVNPADIRIDTFRSSGAGGQHVNTTDSAVRITHHPTGIVVTSSEKSQHQNRDIAMKALKSRLYQLELDRRSAAVVEAHENKGDAGWGNQIRSYVLQPYQMVKDLRTGHETSDTKGVLDGDLGDFMAATLAMNVSGKSRAEAKDTD
ncbi:MAG: PCRF domain-containing protein [Rhodobacteraceae bacterium]|nr:PCRF domain-containing protein [Paracoccaceae bacterium]